MKERIKRTRKCFKIALCTELMALHFGDTDTYPLSPWLQPFLHIQIAKLFRENSPWQLAGKGGAAAAARHLIVIV